MLIRLHGWPAHNRLPPRLIALPVIACRNSSDRIRVATERDFWPCDDILHQVEGYEAKHIFGYITVRVSVQV
jgi:hypothetical protein